MRLTVRPSTLAESYASATEGAALPRAGGSVSGYDQWKDPALPPADQEPVGEREVAVKSPAEPTGPAVAARTVAAEADAEAVGADGAAATAAPPCAEAEARPEAEDDAPGGAARTTSAVSRADPTALRAPRTGVRVRQRATHGVVSAQAGSDTSLIREAQPPP